MAPPPSDLGKLLAALRAARDPWTRLKLVAGGARLLSRLTQRERRELLRKVGLEGAEELADLAGGGDAAATAAVEDTLRMLESNPQQLQRFVRDLSQPQSRRATLAGLAAHVLEAVTAPPPPPAQPATTQGATGTLAAAAVGAPPGLADTPVAVPQAAPATAQATRGEPARPPTAAGAGGRQPRPGTLGTGASRTPAATDAAATARAVPAGPGGAAGLGAAGPGGPGAGPGAAPASTAGAPPAPDQPPRAAAATPPLPATGTGVAAPGTAAAGQLAAGDPFGAVQPEPSSRSLVAHRSPPAPATAATSPTFESAFGAPTRPLAVLQELREQLAAGKPPAREVFVETFERDLPHDWARRRALSALFASGLPPRAEEALDLVGRLATDASRRWALADLAASRAWGDDDFASLLAAADSPASRRRLVNRRPSP